MSEKLKSLFFSKDEQLLIREALNGYSALLPVEDFNLENFLEVLKVVFEDARYLKSCLDKMVAENSRLIDKIKKK